MIPPGDRPTCGNLNPHGPHRFTRISPRDPFRTPLGWYFCPGWAEPEPDSELVKVIGRREVKRGSRD